MNSIKTRHAALIVIDLLQDFFDSSIWPNSLIPESRQILVEKTNDLIASCRSHQLPIIWFRQEFKPDLSDAFAHMRRSGKRYTISGTNGCELLPELHIHPDDTVLCKSRFSAFYETELNTLLNRLGINCLILAGITTSWCVRSTAVDAYQRDYDIILAGECMQAFTTEDHESSLRAMDGYIATNLSNVEILSRMSGG